MKDSQNEKDLKLTDNHKKDIILPHQDELNITPDHLKSTDDNKNNQLLTHNIENSSQPLKKAKLYGYFGPEIIVDDKITKSKIIIRDTSHTKENEEKSSLISLKPPKKKNTITVCKICGTLVKDVIYCPNCGSKLQ